MLNARKSNILRAVIREYVGNARPVGSQALVRKYRMAVSPATIRNEFAELTAEGYLEKPHRSAGRKPTNRGYRYYVNTVVLQNSPVTTGETRTAENDPAALADMLAKWSGLFAAVWREDSEFFFRGLKQILGQPEFVPHDASMRLAELLDRLPNIFEKLFSLDSTSGIFIGDECPFWNNDDVSMLFHKIRFPSKACGIECIIGPTRMPYETNWELLQ